MMQTSAVWVEPCLPHKSDLPRIAMRECMSKSCDCLSVISAPVIIYTVTNRTTKVAHVSFLMFICHHTHSLKSSYPYASSSCAMHDSTSVSLPDEGTSKKMCSPEGGYCQLPVLKMSPPSNSLLYSS